MHIEETRRTDPELAALCDEELARRSFSRDKLAFELNTGGSRLGAP